MTDEHAKIRYFEENLQKYLIVVLDSVQGCYKIADYKYKEILKAVQEIYNMTFNYSVLATSWLGKYLKVISILIDKSEFVEVNLFLLSEIR